MIDSDGRGSGQKLLHGFDRNGRLHDVHVSAGGDLFQRAAGDGRGDFLDVRLFDQILFGVEHLDAGFNRAEVAEAEADAAEGRANVMERAQQIQQEQGVSGPEALKQAQREADADS